MKNFKLILFVFCFVIGAISCHYKDIRARDEKGQGKTFVVEPPESAEVVEQKVDNTGRTQKTLKVSACLKDYVNEVAIRKQKFLIVYGDGTSTEAETDIDGCLSWTETLNYKAQEKARQVVLRRTLISENRHRGSYQMDFALNPWQDDEIKVSDPLKLKETHQSEEDFTAEMSAK